MTNTSINFDLKKGLDLLERLERLTVRGESITSWLWLGKYNAWQAYRERIFIGDIRRFLTQANSSTVTHFPFKSRLKDGLFNFFLVIFSFGSVAWWGLLRPKIMIYSIDKISSLVSSNDQRLDFVYQFIIEKKVRFGELFHGFPGKELIKNILTRKRLATYDVVPDWLFSWQAPKVELITAEEIDGLDNFSVAEKEWVIKLINKYANQIALSEFRIKFFKRCLKIIKPLAIWGIDNARDYQELAVAAREGGIPFVVFQHGHFTKYHVGWLTKSVWAGQLALPDRIMVWSNYWQNELNRLGGAFTQDQIIVGGLKQALPSSNFLTQSKDKVGILIPFETEADWGAVKNYIDLLLSDEAITIYFKLRADMPAEKQLALYGLSANYHPRFITTVKLDEVIDHCQVVAGTYSTFLYDMVAYLKPIALLKTTSDFGEGLVVNGLATMLDLTSSLPEEVKTLAQTPPAILEERSVKLNGDGSKLMDQTLTSLAMDLELI